MKELILLVPALLMFKFPMIGMVLFMILVGGI